VGPILKIVRGCSEFFSEEWIKPRNKGINDQRLRVKTRRNR
jgi:hypothetical protein